MDLHPFVCRVFTKLLLLSVSCKIMINFLLFIKIFRRTLQERLEKGMQIRKTKKWTDLLADVTEDYNNTYHLSINRAPNEVTSENAAEVFDYLESQRNKTPRQTETDLKIGDIVRIPLDPSKKQTFKKGRKANWSEEYYYIHAINYGSKVPMFIVRSEIGAILSRPFYRREINKVMTRAEFEEERKIALRQ